MESKLEYISFCEKNDWVPLFHQPSWWDTVTDQWNVFKVAREDTWAYLPYTLEKKLGFSLSRNPHLTPYSGLLYGSPVYTSAQRHQLQKLALDFLQQFALSEYDSHPLLSKALQTTKSKSTYLLSLSPTLEEIHGGFKSSLKRQLKKADKQLTIVEHKDLDNFYTVYQDSLKRQKGTPPIDKALIAKVLDLCLTNETGTIYEAQDEQGHVHAAIFNVHDKQCSYYLIGGSDHAFMGSGAMGLLLWHCIQLAKAQGKSYFDFEGSEVPGVARFFSTFGGERIEYPVLQTKINTKLKALLKIKGVLGK